MASNKFWIAYNEHGYLVTHDTDYGVEAPVIEAKLKDLKEWAAEYCDDCDVEKWTFRQVEIPLVLRVERGRKGGGHVKEM
jgi:hypothetical protein